ncbi:GNAT family N-acetyltransferase [Halomicronema hongdechloris]|uniref:GNAT family N-acetyltransferase n=1 Tax=Halomicronema hongdechloris TaxID=1209493 RepID=UPI001CEDC429
MGGSRTCGNRASKASSQTIGDVGLIVLEEPNWIDLGFRFAQQFWGRGFATEVASV